MLHKSTWLKLILEFDLIVSIDILKTMYTWQVLGCGVKTYTGLSKWLYIHAGEGQRFQIHSLTSKVHRLCIRERNKHKAKHKFFKSQVKKYSTSCQQRMGSSLLIKTIAYNTHSISTANTNYWNLFLISKMIILVNHFSIFHINNHL